MCVGSTPMDIHMLFTIVFSIHQELLLHPPTPHPTPGPDVSNIVSSLNTIVEKDKDVSFLVKFEVSNYYT